MDNQTEIDTLRRQSLMLELLACVMRNQSNGPPDGKRGRDAQDNLLTAAAVETAHIEQRIDLLCERRDAATR